MLLEKGIALLKLFRKQHGHLCVKQTFKVPSNDPMWPIECQGYNLGRFVHKLRRNKDRILNEKEPIYHELNSINFIWNYREYRAGLMLKALTEYKQLYGDIKVKKAFIVPKDDPAWSPELSDLKLGDFPVRLRNLRVFDFVRPEFERLGFDYSRQVNPPDFPSIVEALKVFQRTHHHFLVPDKWRIGKDDLSYPAQMRGYALGRVVSAIRNDNWCNKKQKQQLVSIGFPFCSHKESVIEMIFNATQVYKKLHGHVKIPVSFIVPEHSEDYAEHTWGLKLGQRYLDIRYKNRYLEYRQQFKDLGITFPTE